VNSFAALIAAVAVRRPALLVLAALVLAFASLSVLHTRQSFDSEILNLLPAGTPSVEGLRIYHSRFNSARELAFLVTSEEESIGEEFVAALRAQPWVLRVLDGPPTESPEGRSTLPELIAPLILGQNSEEFEATASRLSGPIVRERIESLVRRTVSGSPLARMELVNDPLGIVAPVAARLAEKLSVAETFDLVAGTSRLIPVIVTETDLSESASRALMERVQAFVAEFQTKAGPSAPEILVTGRNAYVDEISSSMRRDITITSFFSLLAVTLLFWVSFRSFAPLIGSVLILGLTCLLTLAVGTLLFDKLNVVAMGFCSILLGLGDDFSLLLYQRYLGARAAGSDREGAIRTSISVASPGILWVALTTGIGFATLALSGSAGFGQLGVLIAIGVALGALGMICLMPIFERGNSANIAKDPTSGLTRAFLAPRTFRLAALILGAACLAAALPWRTPRFDTSTQSLEPRDIPAGKALARIMAAFPDAFEPIMVVAQAPTNPEDLRCLDTKLDDLRSRGLISSFSSPSPLVPDAADFSRNLSRIRSMDTGEIERVLEDSERSASLRPGTLDPAIRLLRALQSEGTLAERLPPNSPWWFVLDRSISPTSGDVIFYLRPTAPTSLEARRIIEEEILSAMPGALVTGWSQMLTDLVPWATRELFSFGALVISIILVILMVTYRDARLLLLHTGTMTLAIAGTVATLKLADQQINILNILAFPLILAVGVDYGIHLILAARESGSSRTNLEAVMKPVLISGLTTMTGFGALTLAMNPSLKGFGLVCATGVGWCLFASLCFLAPLCLSMSGPRLARESKGKA